MPAGPAPAAARAPTVAGTRASIAGAGALVAARLMQHASVSQQTVDAVYDTDNASVDTGAAWHRVPACTVQE